jgi:hypothetical protein
VSTATSCHEVVPDAHFRLLKLKFVSPAPSRACAIAIGKSWAVSGGDMGGGEEDELPAATVI